MKMIGAGAAPREERARVMVEDAGRRHERRQTLLLFGLFSIEFIVLWFVFNPDSLGFDHFAFCDQGANLSVQSLIEQGLRPAVDFGYTYGLLPLLLGKLWFGLLGRTPMAYQALMLVCGLLIAWGVARIAAALGYGTLGIGLVVIALGYMIPPSYPSLSQGTEEVLLTFALAEQARGRRSQALAWATAAVLAKPSMAYIYGLVLTVMIVAELVRDHAGLARWLRSLFPAAITGAAIGAVLAAVYGWTSLERTAFPVEGMSNYRAMGFGFLHGSGRAFWDREGFPWIVYLIDVPGFWTAATAVLLVAGIFAARAWYRIALTDSRRAHLFEIVVTCAILHLAFITLLFGNKWSWFYYAYVLIIGVAAIADLSALTRRTVFALCIFGVLSWTARGRYIYHTWATTAPDSATAGLWATSGERAEWSHVISLARGHRAAVLEINGAVEQLFPQFEPPTTLYLLPGLMQGQEIERKVSQIEHADLVVVPSGIDIAVCRGIPDAPQFDQVLREFEPEWEGNDFTVYRRIAVARP